MDDRQRNIVVRGTLIVLLLLALAMILSQLVTVMLLIFAAVLLAVLIRAAAGPFERLGLSTTLASLAGFLSILTVLGLFGWLFGAQIAAQLDALTERLPAAVSAAQGWLATLPFGQQIARATPDLQAAAGQALSIAFGAVGVLTNIVLVLIGAIYLALQPQLYSKGVALLFPKSEGPRVAAALSACAVSLRKYLLGQLFTMTIIGAMVTVGLFIVGVPSASALGLIVGIANFVPLIGPFIGAVPGVLLALAQGPEVALWATLVYFIAQQIEGNVLTPLVQRQAVSIPPAMLIFALAALGTLAGVMGVLVAAPLTVVIYTLVMMLWVRDTLGHEVPIPGQGNGSGHKADRQAGSAAEA